MTPELQHFLEFLSVVGLFTLRVGVPPALVIGLAMALRRMDRRWQAEAEDQRRAALDLPPLLVPNPVMGMSCWEQRTCEGKVCAECAAYAHPSSPCWLSRHAAEGKLPDACPTCGIYRARNQVQPVRAGRIAGATPAA